MPLSVESWKAVGSIDDSSHGEPSIIMFSQRVLPNLIGDNLKLIDLWVLDGFLLHHSIHVHNTLMDDALPLWAIWYCTHVKRLLRTSLSYELTSFEDRLNMTLMMIPLSPVVLVPLEPSLLLRLFERQTLGHDRPLGSISWSSSLLHGV